MSLFVFSFLLVGFQVYAEDTFVPSITVTSPNSGFEAIESGQKLEIRWDSNVAINAMVDVWVSDSIHKGAVVRGSNNGAAGLIYTLDSSLTPGSNYKAYVSLVSETPVIDSSDNPFTIKSIATVPNEDTFVPSITVTSPNSGFEAIEVGKKLEIRWDSNVAINALVDVYVSDGVHKGTVVRTSNNGALGLIYTLSSNLTPGSNYKAYVSLVSETPVIDSSNKPFTIKSAVSDSNTSSITVLSPNNGGESVEVGKKLEIRWTTSPMVGVMLDVYVSDGIHKSTVVRTINTGSLIYTLSNNLTPGSNYKAYVSLVSSNQTVSDSSDNSFTIKASSNTDDTTPSINVSGCTANSNFSITTGQACPKILTENKGCLSGYKFSPITGQACKENTSVVSNESSSDVSTSDTVTTIPIKRTLKKGIKGDDVKILQLFLNLAADGSFGPQTQQKVIEWQIANGLTPDGAFGVKSATKAGLAD